jgi:hypothetical protein
MTLMCEEEAMVATTGGRRIMTHEAQVKTAVVEIRALTINGRQVTQSLFWQLENEDLIDWQTAQLRGVPWGRVNYYRAPRKDDHLHVVWQKGTELRRACVYAPDKNVAYPGEGFLRGDSPPWTAQQEAQQLFEDWVVWSIADQDERVGRIWCSYKEKTAEVRKQGELLSARVPDDAYELYQMRYEGKEPHPLNPHIVWREHGGDGPCNPERVDELYRADLLAKEAARVAGYREQYGTREALAERIGTVVDGLHAHRQRYKESYDAVRALDQLFIAV